MSDVPRPERVDRPTLRLTAAISATEPANVSGSPSCSVTPLIHKTPIGPPSDASLNPQPKRRPDARAQRVLLRPAAFLKLMFCCHAAQTEIGGFGIGSALDPLVVESFELVQQSTSVVTVTFDDLAVADHADRFADQGIGPERSLRIWIHTHPGSSATPSGTDERTFATSFGSCDWSAMLIQSRGEERYCRLQFTAGPGGELILPVLFDWASLPVWLLENELPQLVQGWLSELQEKVSPDRSYASQGDARWFDGPSLSEVSRGWRADENDDAALVGDSLDDAFESLDGSLQDEFEPIGAEPSSADEDFFGWKRRQSLRSGRRERRKEDADEFNPDL